MYCSKEKIIRKSGNNEVDRPIYLRKLVNEFNTSENLENKKQVLANLANFSYDPFNYRWLIELGVIDIFLRELADSSAASQEFSIAGLCNLSSEQRVANLIVRKGGISSILSVLNSSNPQCVINALGCLFYLISSQTRSDVDDSSIEVIFKLSTVENARIANLAKIILIDHFPHKANA